MKDLLNRLVLLVRAQLSHRRARGAQRQRHARGVNAAIERIVDQVNPRLRAVGGYRKRLFPVVERAYVYLHELVERVPGPIRLERRTWAEDPLVNSLFGSLDRMRWVLTGHEVRRYVKEHPLGGDCFAVLVAMPAMRQQLGMELSGERVRRDVRQTTMSFADHEVYLPGESEDDVRDALADAALDLLVSLAEQDITLRETLIAELEDRLRILRLKRKIASARTRGAARILDDDNAESLTELQTLETSITETDRELAEAKKGLETLDDYLDRLVEQLERPEDLLGLEQEQVRLDRMNIVRKDGDSGTVSDIVFTRVRRGEKRMRVINLVHFPRSELLEEGERLRELERHLG